MVKKELIEGIKGVGILIGKAARKSLQFGKKAAGIGLKNKTRRNIIIILVAIAFLCYFLFIFKQTCDTQDCFIENLWKCNGVNYLHTGNDTWHYSIMGSDANSCKVNVKAIKITSDAETAKALEGNEMTCYMPKGTVFMPESRIEYCHGMLKEAIQDQIIKKMHLYIVENLGEIKELPKVV